MPVFVISPRKQPTMSGEELYPSGQEQVGDFEPAFTSHMECSPQGFGLQGSKNEDFFHLMLTTKIWIVFFFKNLSQFHPRGSSLPPTRRSPFRFPPPPLLYVPWPQPRIYLKNKDINIVFTIHKEKYRAQPAVASCRIAWKSTSRDILW